MKSSRLGMLGGLLSAVLSMRAQSAIIVGPNVLVSDDGIGAHFEPFVAADLSEERSQRMLASALVDLEGSNRFAPKLYRSADGGSTWVDSILPGGQDVNSAFNYQVAFDRHGAALVVGLMGGFRPGLERSQRSGQELYFYRSLDGGATWKRPIDLGFDDYPQLVVDTTTGRFADRIYIWSREGLYRSENGGRTFIGPVEAHLSASNADPALIFSDGCLFLPRREWSETPETNKEDIEKGSMVFATSCDGGVSMSPMSHIQDQMVPGSKRVLAMRKDRRIDSGSSLPKYAIDPKSDRLYVVWGDFRYGQSRVLFSSSQDRGKDWSDPAQVSAQVPTGSAQFQPSIAVNDKGIVGVQWFDTRDSAAGDAYKLYFTASEDGGRSFEQAVRVSSAASYPRRPESQKPLVFGEGSDAEVRVLKMTTMFGRYPDGGDYMGLTADVSGAFHPVWVDNRSGTDQIYTATVSITSGNPNASVKAPATTEADVSKMTSFRSDPAEYDAAKEEFVLPVRIYNKSKKTIYGPLTVEVTAIDGSKIVNASNGKTGIGAVFSYGGALGDVSGLAPGGITEPISWRIKYDDWSLMFFSLRVKIIGFVSE